jgi:hypothetical protein
MTSEFLLITIVAQLIYYNNFNHKYLTILVLVPLFAAFVYVLLL